MPWQHAAVTDDEARRADLALLTVLQLLAGELKAWMPEGAISALQCGAPVDAASVSSQFRLGMKRGCRPVAGSC